MHIFIPAVLSGLFIAAAAQADGLRALARVNMAESSVADTRDGVAVTLALTQAVPYRVYTLDDPMRVVMEFQEVTFGPSLDPLDRSERIQAVRGARATSGGSVLVLELVEPMEVTQAALETAETGGAVVRLRLAPIPRDDFADRALASDPAQSSPAQNDDGRLVVALDPGHGGADLGAQLDGANEAELMLQFARELREALLRGGADEVVLTRDADRFTALSARVSAARAADADILVSLHADGLGETRAGGVTVFTLSKDASDQASELLAQRQDRQDILAGVDMRTFDDEVAAALMDLARLETAPRAERLADQLVASLGTHLVELHKTPRLKAGFSVLKAPDIPSVLIELGIAEQGRANVLDATWRKRAASAIVDGVMLWALDEEARNR